LLHPRLMLFDSAIPKEEAVLLDLSETPELSVISTLRPGELPKTVFDYLSPRSRISYFSDTSAPVRPPPR
jgi:hypothetical protein